MFTFQDVRGMASWGVAIDFLLMLVGFFPLVVLFGIGTIWGLTAWRASQ